MTDATSEALATITSLVRSELNLEIEDVDTDLIEAGLVDSLMLVEMIFLLEEEFGVEIRLDRIGVESFRSLREIAMLIERLDAPAGHG